MMPNDEYLIELPHQARQLLELLEMRESEATLSNLICLKESLVSTCNSALENLSPRGVWKNAMGVDQNPIFLAAQRLGALDRLVWVGIHGATGSDDSLRALEDFIQPGCRLLAAQILIASMGSAKEYALRSPEAHAALGACLARITSRTIDFAWVNYEIQLAMAQVVTSDKIWAQEMAEMRSENVRGLVQWQHEQYFEKVMSEVDDRLTFFPFAAKLAEVAAGSRVEKLLESRDLGTKPFRKVEGVLVVAGAASSVTNSYLGVLEWCSLAWASSRDKKVSKWLNRDKGSLFENSIAVIVAWYLGRSDLVGERFSVKPGKSEDDVDFLWISPGGVALVGECKSYVPTPLSENSHTKIESERSDIGTQLKIRLKEISEGRVMVDGVMCAIEPPSALRGIGVSVDPGVGPHVETVANYDIHFFTVGGLLCALRSFPNFDDFDDYLALRKAYLSSFPYVDEMDIIIPIVRGEKAPLGRLFTLRPQDIWYPSREFACHRLWKHFLINDFTETAFRLEEF